MIIYKTMDEIKKIKKANEIIARLFEDVLPQYIKPGISTHELDQIAEDYNRSSKQWNGEKSCGTWNSKQETDSERRRYTDD